MKKMLSVSSALALVALSTPANAQQALGFGQSGQIAISSDFWTSVSFTSHSGGGTTTEILLAPALDYFAAENVSVGGQVLFAWAKSGDWHTEAFGIAPRVGYDVPLAERLSLWPRLAVVYQMQWEPNDRTDKKLSISAYAPFLVHPAQHFFIGIGPSLSVDLWSRYSANGISGDRSKDTTISLVTTLGGWF